jgi:hypothetical protein
VVASNGGLDRAAHLLGHGATRVIDALAAPYSLHSLLPELLNVAPRVAAEAPVRLGIALAPDTSMPSASRRSTVCRTLNLSATGMLVATEREEPPGTLVPFELALSDQAPPLRGWAEVIRVATPPKEAAPGLGLRFRAFSSDGRRRFSAYLERLGA